MKLRLNDHPGRDSVRTITKALLQVDIGARINFDLAARLVRIEGRLSVDDARTAIARSGLQVASIVDGTIADAVFRPSRAEVIAF